MRALLIVTTLLAAAPGALAQQLLDRTLALVGGQAITLSDAKAAIALGLIDAKSPESAVDELIRRELILREVQRYAPAPPSAAAVDAKLAEVRQRFADAAALERVLDANAFSGTRLRAWVSDDLRTDAYLAQRFASASTPTDAEVSRYYADHKESFDRRQLSFDDATPQIRRELVDSRRAELILDWVSDLRRRTEVVILQP